MRLLVTICAIALVASSAAAQLPGLRKRGAPPPTAAPVIVGIDALRADFLAQTRSDTVFFGTDSVVLSPQAKATLAAQALWLRQHPVLVRIEGHADSNDTRDHGLAVGARRAEEVRQFLVLMGVPAAQVTAVSMGKERPGLPRAQTILVR
jgi:peptidoglycan-associated lipoprotein